MRSLDANLARSNHHRGAVRAHGRSFIDDARGGELRKRTVGTPFGCVELFASAHGLCALVLPGASRIPPWLKNVAVSEADGALEDAARQLESYLQGSVRGFRLSLDLRGTVFQMRVWRWLLTVPYGQTVSYRQAAAEIGLPPSAARAVASAVAANPLPVIVPCHRLIAADGSLAGYVGGLDRKRRLLDLEAGAAALPL